MATLAGSRHREFERLYADHVLDVYRFALSLLRDPSAAEDVTQTTFLNAFRALESGEHPRKPESWLLAIAHNAARSRRRRALRRPREVSLDEAAELVGPEPDRQNVPALVGALRRLPANQRAAVTMRELEGRTYPEIATKLGVTVPAVEALLSRARRTLRAQASAIRGLGGAFGLPALRDALGAAGAVVAAKSATIVIAGVVAGGAATATGDASPQSSPRPVQAVPVSGSASPHRRAVHVRHVAKPGPSSPARTAPPPVLARATPAPARQGADLPSTGPSASEPAPAPAPVAASSPAVTSAETALAAVPTALESLPAPPPLPLDTTAVPVLPAPLPPALP